MAAAEAYARSSAPLAGISRGDTLLFGRFVYLAALSALIGGAAGLAPPSYPAPEQPYVWSVVVNEAGQAALVEGRAGKEAIAWGSFTDKIHETGWAVLDVHTSEKADGQQQGYAAGFLEGALTSKRMLQHLGNMWTVDFPGHKVGSMPDAVRIFVADNIDWMWQQTALHEEDPYWRVMASLLAQLRGLTDGYNHAAARSHGELRPLLETEVFMLSLLDADMDDVVTAIALNGSFVNVHGGRHHGHRAHPSEHGLSEHPPKPAKLSDMGGHPERLSELLDERPGRRGHCSALVQPAPDWSDLWVSHTTWDEYRGMMKVIKYFDMPIPTVAVRRMVFTSTPGTLYSADDFYNTDAGLTIIETTITNYNRSGWKQVVPQSVMTWGRAMVATRLATSGAQWTELAQRYVSGTCNNQWMVVDYNRFHPRRRPQKGDGLLWILETMPGYARRADMTGVLLSQGSWPSYNIPYFSDVQEVGGYFEMQKKHPRHVDDYSFTGDPRARMFARARERDTVTSLDSFVHLMRDTGKNDPFARNDRCNAISARCDLNPQDHGYDCFGAIDAKVSRWRHDVRKDLSFMAVLSPAHSGDGSHSPPFAWSQQSPHTDGCRPSQHVGHPDMFNFSWYSFPARMEPPPRSHHAHSKDTYRSHAWYFAAAAPAADEQTWQGAAFFLVATSLGAIAASAACHNRCRHAGQVSEAYLRLEA